MPNPGGTIDPKDIIGRNKIVKRMYNTLEVQSVVLVSERRVGKTCVLKKLKERVSDNPKILCFLMEVSGLESPIEFIEKIYDSLNKSLSLPKRKRAWSFLKKQYKLISGQKVGDWHLPELRENWKELLWAVIRDLTEHFPHRFIFMFDEFPTMIDKIAENEGSKTAMNLLDTLRDIRQEDEEGKIRMVFCGSIGLHIVLSKLKKEGYKSAPFNDTATVLLEPLEDKYAIQLGTELAKGCKIELENSSETAKHIANSVDNFPFYIHHLFAAFDEQGLSQIDKGKVDQTLDTIILDPYDPIAFEHYIGRIDVYYPDGVKPLARFLLTFLSTANKPHSFSKLWNELKTHFELSDPEIARQTLELLVKDHYLSQTREGDAFFYEFKYQIIQKWWALRRGEFES